MSTQAPPAISVVVPVYREEANIGPFLKRLEPVLEAIGTYEILFCLDPSPDGTERVIREHIERNDRIRCIVFSRRFGQPAATMAGILDCRGECCCVIDVDLQDPPELIAEMYARYREGCEVVYAQRRTREGESLPKLAIAYLGYKVINKVSDVGIPRNTGDFRIMSRRVIEELRKLNESHGFLRGLVAFVGFRQAAVLYDRDRRTSGAGNYNRYFGSIKIGLNGLVGYSNFLLSLSTIVGFAIAGAGFLTVLGILYAKLVMREPYPLGTPTIICLVLLLSGVQLVSIGILGEYVGRIYDEVKRRPQYIIDRMLGGQVQDAAVGATATPQARRLEVAKSTGAS